MTGESENRRSYVEQTAACLDAVLPQAICGLLSSRDPSSGKWVGELSSSALATATAVCALSILKAKSTEGEIYDGLIQNGLLWLVNNQNADGGWGDTVRSTSNISTTALCWAAFGAVPGADVQFRSILKRCRTWLDKSAGGNTTEHLVHAIERRYGKDRTFSVPILMTCALGGRLGRPKEAWRRVHALPFELAAVPHQFYGILRLPVVSYALPALIAIGQVQFYHCPSRNPLTRVLRQTARTRTLRILENIQPRNGGFLEAIPLTSFVLMSMAAMNLGSHPVAVRAKQFITASVRGDGSWAIDTNLSTWLTTLATNALVSPQSAALSRADQAMLAQKLINEQTRCEHPYTHSAPGGWAWTELPGGVPDADDTASAVLALYHLREAHPGSEGAALRGLRWLVGVQNADGGIPTFCRGWGALPFDRSSADITAHFIRAAVAWLPHLDADLITRILRSLSRAIRYLEKTQREEGAWVPLWFGNENNRTNENPVYGTTRVLMALATAQNTPGLSNRIGRATAWLFEAQNGDGGWGGAPGIPSSAEESALAVEALATLLKNRCCSSESKDQVWAALARGVQYLRGRVETGEWQIPSPIGFYFANLWYFEKLYPIIFTTAALRAAHEAVEAASDSSNERRNLSVACSRAIQKHE